MTTLLSHKKINKVGYLCSEQWTPIGLCKTNAFSQGIATQLQEDNKTIEAEIEILPKGYIANSINADVFLIKEGSDPIDCLFCNPVCGSSTYLDDGDKIVELINLIRTSYPDQCPPPDCNALVIDDRLQQLARYRVQSFVLYDYFSEKDHRGQTVVKLAKQFGIYAQNIKELLFTTTLTEEDTLSLSVIEQAIAEWINDEISMQKITEPTCNAIGASLDRAEKTNEQGEKVVVYYISCIIAELSVIKQLPRHESNCAGECVGKIRWTQLYDILRTYEHPEGIKIPKPKLEMRVKIPRLCHIEKLKLFFEISPCKAELDFSKTENRLQPIPEDSQISYIWEQYFQDDEWVIIWNLDHTSCFVPGEWIQVQAYIKNYSGDCHPVTVAWGWFETPCWTSGIIQGCGLFVGGELVAGGYLHHLDESWTNSPSDIRWLVLYKGNFFWIKASDFADYSIGSRCFIYKRGAILEETACRFPLGADGDILSDTNVSYFLDEKQDIIIPQVFQY